MIKRLLPLLGIVAASWILILGLSFLLFEVILPFSIPIHRVGTFAIESILKLVFVFALVVVWFGVAIFLWNLYSRSKG
jgi:hypothetical protein